MTNPTATEVCEILVEAGVIRRSPHHDERYDTEYRSLLAPEWIISDGNVAWDARAAVMLIADAIVKTESFGCSVMRRIDGTVIKIGDDDTYTYPGNGESLDRVDFYFFVKGTDARAMTTVCAMALKGLIGE